MPKFLEDRATNEDKLGGTHKKLAENLKKIIESLNISGYTKNIIGLFGNWGSGKSSIIKQIENEENKYKVLEFDSRSHKDEFLKRAFLIELTKKIGFEEKSLQDIGFGNEKLKGIKTIDYLGKKNTIKTLDIKPQTNFGGLGRLGALMLFLISLKIIGIDVLGLIGSRMTPFLDLKLFSSVNSLYLQYNDGIYLAFIIILLVIFIGRFYPFFKSKDKSDFKSLVDYLLFKKIDYSENITSSEDEDFSNYDYQEFFTLITRKYLKSEENKNLIIVLDNLDRVDDNIVLNSISLIQTTFEGIKNEEGGNIFNRLIFILPIDKQRLKEVFEKLIKTTDKSINRDEFTEGFIDKTFSVIVDIPKLEQSKWRKFFKDKMIFAFSEEEINNLNLGYLTSSFYLGVKRNKDTNKKDSNIDGKNITPREIINYINELVSNFFFFGDKIPLLHQGIYVLLKRYYPDFLKNIDNDSYIKDNNKLKNNEILKKILGEDFKILYENLLKQCFKSDEVYNILYLDEFIESIKLGENKKINDILDKITSEDNIDSLIDKGLKDIDENKPDIDVLGKMIFVMQNTTNKYLKEKGKVIMDNIANDIDNISSINAESSKGIIQGLINYENKLITEKLPKNIIKAIVLANKDNKNV